MASRGGGTRPSGTDGTDFKHREKVASQYAIRFLLLNIKNKKKFFVIFLFLFKKNTKKNVLS